MTFKSGFIAVIGRPNVGKSTLTNRIAGEKISIISPKPQTTRNQIKAILTDEESQIIFVDTPGFQKARNKLGETMENAVETALEDVDGVIYIIDAADDKPGGGDIFITEKLKAAGVPVIVAINKIDTAPKEKLLKIMQSYGEQLDPVAIVPISALKNQGIEELMIEVRKLLPEGPLYYEDDIATDSTEREIAAETIREKLLMLLSDEIPHGIGVEITKFKQRPGSGITDIEAEVICEKESHKGIIIGKNGEVLKKAGSLARVDLEGRLDAKIFLKLWVKVRENWRNDDAILKNLGYK